MERRDFLKHSTAGALTVSAGLAVPDAIFANAPRPKAKVEKKPDPVEKPVLIVVYLRGGQDALNTVVPYKDRTYYSIRPTVAIPKERVLDLDGTFGLHPALAPLKDFYDNGKLAVVVNSGSPHPTRSHFDAQDFMEYAAIGVRTVRDGWVNRYLQATAAATTDDKDASNEKKLRAIAMQDLLPRSMRGTQPVVTVPSNLREINEVLDLFEDFYSTGDPAKASETLQQAAKAVAKTKRGKAAAGTTAEAIGVHLDPVMASGRDTIEGLRRLRALLYGADAGGKARRRDDDDGSGYSNDGFAQSLRGLAKVIKADVGLEVAGVDINGWDHHIGMGSIDGTLNRMLGSMAGGLAAFMKDLGPHLDRTVVMMCTEFGRVPKENGNDGSDHGHGSVMWVMGGKVNGGVHGKWLGLEPSALFEKRDLPVTTDFRDVFREVLRYHMGFEPEASFFPQFKPSPSLGLFA